jgi:hypothetical protein
MELENKYWMVVWHKTNGDFKIAYLKDNLNQIEELSAEFEIKNPDYLVIHIGEGNLPPKTYRSLDCINSI